MNLLNGRQVALAMGEWMWYIMGAFDQAHKEERNRFRHDGVTPHGIHSVFCATLVLHEPWLDFATRIKLFLILLFHDVIEDTRAGFPKGLSEDIRQVVLEEMTYLGGGKEEREQIWNKSPTARLAKLYDKYSNLLTTKPGAESWDKVPIHAAYIRKLADKVEEEHPRVLLNIVPMAQELAQRRENEYRLWERHSKVLDA